MGPLQPNTGHVIAEAFTREAINRSQHLSELQDRVEAHLQAARLAPPAGAQEDELEMLVLELQGESAAVAGKVTAATIASIDLEYVYRLALDLTPETRELREPILRKAPYQRRRPSSPTRYRSAEGGGGIHSVELLNSWEAQVVKERMYLRVRQHHQPLSWLQLQAQAVP